MVHIKDSLLLLLDMSSFKPNLFFLSIYTVYRHHHLFYVIFVKYAVSIKINVSVALILSCPTLEKDNFIENFNTVLSY